MAAALRLFPGAPEPFIDLSTGINPHPYPVPNLPPEVFARLPEPEAIARLEALAADRFGAPSPAHVVAAPGTQILLPLVASLVPPGTARVLGPTYAEHLRAAQLAGHESQEVTVPEALAGAALAVIVNPNNPDGRLLSQATLTEIATRSAASGCLLLVDEAFIEVAPDGTSVAERTNHPGLVVLRSFGKFHGLAGVRLGFAVTNTGTAERIRAQLGPWAVSGPAIAIGMLALADRAWAARMRENLARDAARLDRLLHAKGLAVFGGTNLFRLAEGRNDLFQTLGRAGIMVRRFSGRPGIFRFGIPPHEEAWARLSSALNG